MVFHVYRTMLAAHHSPPHALCSTADFMNYSYTCVPVDRSSLHREYSNLFSLVVVRLPSGSCQLRNESNDPCPQNQNILFDFDGSSEAVSRRCLPLYSTHVSRS